MKLEFGDTEEYIKLRTDFNKETKSMAMLNKVGYIKWLEHKLVNNINYTRCCTELPDKNVIKITNEEINKMIIENKTEITKEVDDLDVLIKFHTRN